MNYRKSVCLKIVSFYDLVKLFFRTLTGPDLVLIFVTIQCDHFVLYYTL